MAHPGRHVRRLRSITALASAQVLRTPARTAVAGISVAIGVDALTVVLAVRPHFRRAWSATVLGEAVSIQVHVSATGEH